MNRLNSYSFGSPPAVLHAVGVLILCTAVYGQAPERSFNHETFANYWYQGKGEITRYALEQSRYGQVHAGDAVLIFVTEDFDAGKQVKLETGAVKDKVSVMHMNFMKKFNTGVYPYSLMTSVFTPVPKDDLDDNGGTLKVSSSSQEWCGQMYTQLNRTSRAYGVQSHSYFQAEGDQRLRLGLDWLEDELWTMIRLRPEQLPTGEVKLIPGFQYVRLNHVTLQQETARCSLIELEGDDAGYLQYSVVYATIERRLEIVFDKTFPFAIERWEESSRRSADQPWQTSRAHRTHSLQLDYWNHHNVEDLSLRASLGLQ